MSAPGPIRGTTGKDEWQTPQYIFDYWNNIYHFDVDAAASASNALCTRFYDKEFDSLNNDWEPGLRYWVNPPFGNLLGWMRRFSLECERGSTVVACLPNNTDTKWFMHLYETATKGTFLEGRISYIDPETGLAMQGNVGGTLFGQWHPEPYRIKPIQFETIRIPKPKP